MNSPNGQYNYARLTGNGIVKTGSGLLGGFLVASGAPTITIYDGVDNTGTLILNGWVGSASTAVPCMAKFVAGCYAVVTGGDVTFLYE